MDLMHLNYETQIMELSQKVRELNESTMDKLKKLDTANKLNTELKTEVTKLQVDNKKLGAELDTLRQSNSVIQKEFTKSTQRCVALEKEKTLMQEKFRLDMETLKNEPAYDSSVSQNIQVQY